MRRFFTLGGENRHFTSKEKARALSEKLRFLLAFISRGKKIALAKDLNENDPQTISQPIFSKKEFGELAPVLDLVGDFGVFMHQENHKIETAFDTLFTEEFFDMHQLCDSNSIQMKIDALGSLEQELNRSQNRIIERLQKHDSDIETYAKKHLKTAEAFLEGYHRGRKNHAVDFNNLYHFQRKVILATKELLQFLQSIEGQYEEMDGKIVFETDEQVENFNKLNTRIVELAEEAEEEARRKQSLLSNYKNR